MTEAPEDTILDLDDRSEDPEVEPFRFRFGGETFTCQHPEALDIRDLGAIISSADQDPSVMLPVMLPPVELERLVESEHVFDLGMLRKLQEGWQAHYKLDPPKSQRSRKSSSSKKIR